MGLRFRKSIKVAPGVKLNLNKNSASVTVGTKGAHYTVNTSGKKTTSAGIPGTGISYVSTKGGGKKQETKSNKKTAPKAVSTTKTNSPTNSSKKNDGKMSKKPAKTQPKKKGGCLKSILIVVVFFIIIAAIGTIFGGNNDSKKSNSTLKSNDSTPPEEKSQVVEEHYEIDLSAGNYTAGTDIPTGTYNLTATSGSGNVSSTNLYNGGLNEIMANPVDEYSSDSFNGLKLDSGVILRISNTVTLHLVSENANVAGVTARSSDNATPIDLGAGNYTCGTDFPAGTYNIIATGGSGNVSSDNMYDGGLNEIMGTTNDGYSITQFNNAIFQDGNILTISGTTIQLIPVGE